MYLRPQPQLAVAVLLAVGLARTLGAASVGPLASQPVAGTPAEATTVLKVALADEGFRFVETGEVFARGASDPDVVRLPSGELLAVFARPDAAKSKSGLAERSNAGERAKFWVSRSKDDGKTWLPSRPIQVQGLAEEARIGDLDLLVMPSGLVRMYLSVSQPAERARGREESFILSAVTRDGVEYQLDHTVRVPCPGTSGVRPSAWRADKQIVLMVAGQADARSTGSATAQQFTSRDGRTFKSADRPRPVGGLGHVVQLDAHHWRMYVNHGGEIRAEMSNDGLRWYDESGTCLKGGSDAAVAPLSNRKYVMLFCAEADRQGAERPPLTVATSEPGASGDASAEPSSKKDAAGSGASGDGDTSGKAVWEPFTTASTSVEGVDEQTPVADGQATGDAFPPKPDLIHPVNYMEWLGQQHPADIENNALDAYDAFMPNQRYPFSERPGFPSEINDMFNSEYSGPIIPWDPIKHPGWEATHNSMQGLLDQFRQATHYERYACPLAGGPRAEASPDGVQPLVSLALPSLVFHRAMMKATMADAWRAENGQADPARMVDAFETCLRNADHMEQGYTVIHHLVGIAEQSLVESNALIALQRNVFTSPQEMETALNTLEQYDRYDSAAATWLPTEHAAALDTIQYLFPPGDDGQPHLNRERAAYLVRNFDFNTQGKPEYEIAEAVQAKIDNLAGLSPEEVRQSVEDIDSGFRELREKWQTGYPQVRAKDVDDLAVSVHDKNGLLNVIMPSLARAYHLTGRNEATRRATQLTYEVHLFKARNGRWPSSLDEVPVRPGSNSHTDPFTGSNFGYKLGENGPTIYTAGEDGQDNGGEHSDWNGDGNDYVFWPQK